VATVSSNQLLLFDCCCCSCSCALERRRALTAALTLAIASADGCITAVAAVALLLAVLVLPLLLLRDCVPSSNSHTQNNQSNTRKHRNVISIAARYAIQYCAQYWCMSRSIYQLQGCLVWCQQHCAISNVGHRMLQQDDTQYMLLKYNSLTCTMCTDMTAQPMAYLRTDSTNG
jgi:hypothetical protein